MDRDADRQAHRARAVEAFWAAARAGAARLAEEAPAAWRGPEARFYRAEAAAVVAHANPLFCGLGVACALFVTFRVTGSKSFQLYRDLYLFGRHMPIVPPADPRKGQWRSLLDRRREEKANMTGELTRLPLDLFISVMGGGSAALLLSHPDQLRRDFVDAPLAPGKSLIYSTMCPALEEAFDQQRPAVFESVADGTLEAFEGFVRNCRIRSEYTQERTHQGHPRPDVVPYPGLEGVRR